jgi:hypothetical protein
LRRVISGFVHQLFDPARGQSPVFGARVKTRGCFDGILP